MWTFSKDLFYQPDLLGPSKLEGKKKCISDLARLVFRQVLVLGTHNNNEVQADSEMYRIECHGKNEEVFLLEFIIFYSF